jgi:hypothetical protein
MIFTQHAFHQMKTPLSSPSILALSLLLGACSNAPSTASATPSSSEHKATAPASSSTASPPPDLDDLRVAGIDRATILRSASGDLNGDGRPDLLVVLNRSSTDKDANDRRPRTVLLLIRDADGHLQRTAQNDRIVPCEDCGGLLGDPFAYARIDKDGFTLGTEGGSRYRWWNEFTFKYANGQTWVLEKVQRGVGDNITKEAKDVTLTTKDFGLATFGGFDPSTLPAVAFP